MSRRRALEGQLALTGIAVPTDTREPVRTTVPVTSDRGVPSTGTLVPTGSRTGTGTAPDDWFPHPLRGCGTSLSRSGARKAGTGTSRVDGYQSDADIMDLSAALLPSLPLKVSLVGRSEYDPLPFTVTSSRAVWQALRRLRRVVFGVLEWKALLASVGNDRARPADWLDWCRAKQARPTFKVTLRDTLGRLPASSVEPAPNSLTVGGVFGAFALVLTAVWYGDELPVPVPVKGGRP